MLHLLKIEKQYYDLIDEGKKTLEIRLNDRDFHEGEYLQFKLLFVDDWVTMPLKVLVTHVLHFPDGLKDGYVALSIRKI